MPRVGGCQPHRRVKAGCGRPPEDVSAEVTFSSVIAADASWDYPVRGHRWASVRGRAATGPSPARSAPRPQPVPRGERGPLVMAKTRRSKVSALRSGRRASARGGDGVCGGLRELWSAPSTRGSRSRLPACAPEIARLETRLNPLDGRHRRRPTG